VNSNVTVPEGNPMHPLCPPGPAAARAKNRVPAGG